VAFELPLSTQGQPRSNVRSEDVQKWRLPPQN
jgi:hypothetical protein